jgi:hypothetical protein
MDIDSIILKYCKELLSFDSFSAADIANGAANDFIKSLPPDRRLVIEYLDGEERYDQKEKIADFIRSTVFRIAAREEMKKNIESLDLPTLIERIANTLK